MSPGPRRARDQQLSAAEQEAGAQGGPEALPLRRGRQELDLLPVIAPERGAAVLEEIP